MKQSRALKAFAALSHETRLDILRLLIAAGPDGLSAGEIGAQISVMASRLSFHLGVLEQAGLVSSRRKSRNVIYGAEYDRLSGLVTYLMQDCCCAHPSICTGSQVVKAPKDHSGTAKT